MKVLHVIPSLSSVHGGPSQAILLMEQALLAQKVAVETATTDDDGPGLRNGKPTGSPLFENSVFRHYFPKRLEFYKVSPAFAGWIFRHVRDYDLIHIHALFSFTSIVAAWAARWAGIPYVIRPLGTLNRYGVTQHRPLLKRTSLKIIEGPILGHAAAVQFTHQDEQREAETLGIPMRSMVISLGVESDVQADGALLIDRFPELRNKPCILFLSRLDPKKNVEGLLHAFKLTCRELPDARLIVAGDGEPAYVVGLKNLSMQLGLHDKVVWTGHIEGELKANAFAAAKVFVLPSYSENFGIAAAEALMAGLPCVLGKGVAIAGDVTEAGAGVAVSTNPEDIAREIVTILSNESLRMVMSGKAAALALERYSVQGMGKKLAKLYADIQNDEKKGQGSTGIVV